MQFSQGVPRRVRTTLVCFATAIAPLLLPSSRALAQQRTVRVIGDDGAPVAFANVTLKGERPQITNEQGDVPVGTRARPNAVADVRRLGYEPWYGTLALGDSQMVATVTLHRLTRRMFTVKITDSSQAALSYLHGFYERMLARQRGIGSGIYLTPEDVEKRNASLATGLLQGLNGVSLQRLASGRQAVMSADGSCQMTVLVDGHVICPEGGCGHGGAAMPAPQQLNVGRRAGISPRSSRVTSNDNEFVAVDDIVSATDVAAVELYPRGGSVPPGLPTVDPSCGAVAFWTGGRKAP
jgi:hypothetical protein